MLFDNSRVERRRRSEQEAKSVIQTLPGGLKYAYCNLQERELQVKEQLLSLKRSSNGHSQTSLDPYSLQAYKTVDLKSKSEKSLLPEVKSLPDL